MDEADRPKLGVSACLLGRKVRYDGGHKHDAFLTGTLARFVDFVPVCPELELGLGVPRPTLRLEGQPGAERMVMPATGEDLTSRMRSFSRRRIAALPSLDGFVLKKDSPSCGVFRVRVYGKGASHVKQGQGVFAKALLEANPLLPVEEEGRLLDAALRETFVERVWAYRRLRTELLEASRPRPKDLVSFHARHKLALSSRDAQAYRRLGRLVAGAGAGRFRPTLEAYASLFMATLAKPATRRRNTDVLLHLLGHLKTELDAGDKAELLGAIDAYRRGVTPLLVPLTLLRHHLRRHPAPWAEAQTWLQPWPPELVMRSAT